MDALEQMALEAYDRLIGLKLSNVSMDCCITKAQCGGEKAGKSPVDRGKGHQALEDGRRGGQPTGGALRLAPSSCPSMRAYTSIVPTTRASPESFWQRVAWWA